MANGLMSGGSSGKVFTSPLTTISLLATYQPISPTGKQLWVMEALTNQIHLHKQVSHRAATTMPSFLFRLLSLSLLLAQVNHVESFATSSSRTNILFYFQSSHQLSAFQVSPFLPFRGNNNPTGEDTTSPPHLQVITESTPSSTLQEVRHSDQSMPLIRAIWFNQAAIFLLATAMATLASFVSGNELGLSSLHWNTSPDYHSLFDWSMNQARLIEGVLATIPMVILGSAIEQSDRRDASHVNFSTINMVISLFGRRKSSRDPEATSSTKAMTMAALIALSTGLSEELVFRGYIPTAIETISHSFPLALSGQAALFAVAHISPKASSDENKIVGGLQLLNGLWYGVVYTVSGGDVLPCIIAHMLYDMHVLCSTWHGINKQMDYTQDAFQQELAASENGALEKIQQKAGPSLTTDTLNLARRFFYAFDYEHKGSLCVADVHRAVTYAFLQDEVVPDSEEVDDVFDHLLHSRDASSNNPQNRLTVSEFLRLLFTLKSKGAIAL